MLFRFFDKVIRKIILRQVVSGSNKPEIVLNFFKKNFPIFSSTIQKYLKVYQEATSKICSRPPVTQPVSPASPLEPSPITFLAIILTHKCNLECAYCLRDAKKDETESEIDFETLEQIILTAYRLGCRGCGLTGGEPLLYSQLEKVINLLSSLDWGVLIETNGKILTPELCDFFKKKLKDKLRIMISLDSFSQKSHDILRSKGSFDLAVRAIKLVKSRGIKLETNAILTPENFMTEKDLLNFIDFNKNLGTDLVHLGRVVPLGRGKDKKNLLSPSQIIEFGKILEKYNYWNNYLDGAAFNLSWPSECKHRGCRRLRREICISPAGLHPCVFQERIKIGRLEDFKNIIWQRNLFDLITSIQGSLSHSYQERGLPFSCAECVQELPNLLFLSNKIEIL